jgi:two-component system phosphate regulon sensor histidine kinase PhoR
MTISIPVSLASVIRQEKQPLLARWRLQVRQIPSARTLDIPTLNDHIPVLLDELADGLEADSDDSILDLTCSGGAPFHGLQRLENDFDIAEVVAEYNLLRSCINDLADDHGLDLRGKPLRIVNRILDRAIGAAVSSHAERRARDVQQRREEYLGFVAHDLRTPLNVISLAARVLEADKAANGDGPNAKMLHALHRNVRQLEMLVGKVLDENVHIASEIGVKLTLRDFDLWPLVESLVQDLSPLAMKAGTRLVNDMPDDLIAHADASLVRRIFQNLIANAIRYTPDGEVEIGAHAIGDDGSVECWVKDNGEGVPAELVDTVFDRGASDPDREEAMGLGLAIVRQFAEAHGGTVTVQSRPGIGSMFCFTLPGKGAPQQA